MADGIIRNPDRFREYTGKQRGMEWRFLRGRFDYGIMPSDIDGVVERKGHYLFFEEKSPGVELEENSGQWKMFNDLTLNKMQTLFIIWGDTSVPYIQEMSIWRPGTNKNRHKFNADVSVLEEKCRAWFDWVERK